MASVTPLDGAFGPLHGDAQGAAPPIAGSHSIRASAAPMSMGPTVSSDEASVDGAPPTPIHNEGPLLLLRVREATAGSVARAAAQQAALHVWGRLSDARGASQPVSTSVSVPSHLAAGDAWAVEAFPGHAGAHGCALMVDGACILPSAASAEGRVSAIWDAHAGGTGAWRGAFRAVPGNPAQVDMLLVEQGPHSVLQIDRAAEHYTAVTPRAAEQAQLTTAQQAVGAHIPANTAAEPEWGGPQATSAAGGSALQMTSLQSAFGAF